ncbi:MAG: hypothetical protein IJK63_07125 [Oscillospiraceae bacterium]|nr:hypothetical protein [Oscillospiraceae bacterium]
MLGKQKCKILKEIRQRIADENDIPYVTSECTHKGACKGTCPKCESELRYLEQQLALRQSMGKRVAVAALCAGLAFGAAGCGPADPEPTPTPDYVDVLEGEVAPYPDDLDGMVPNEPDPTEEPDEWELEGDVACIPDDADENGNG